MFITRTTKSPFYQLVHEVNGKRTTISTKTKNKTEAYLFMQKFISDEIQQKQNIQNITLSKFAEEYFSYSALTKSQNYLRSIKLAFKHFSLYCGDIELKKIDIRLAETFIAKTSARAEKSAHLYFRTLKAAFSNAERWNFISANPFKKIRAPKIKKSFPAFITNEELQKIIQCAPQQILQNIFITAFYTGMRLGELLSMKWNWIDFHSFTITLKQSASFATKSKKERVIPFNQNLLLLFKSMAPKIQSIHNESFVFSKIPGIRLNENYVSKKIKNSVRAAGLSDEIHFHSLRHSFASNLVQKGVSLYVVKELLGHEELSTTQIYSHLQHQNLRAAVNLL